MKFYDEARVTIVSGRGGDGLIAGRREAGVPFGGPAGGDGGRGGSVYFQADENINTLMTLRYKSIWKADKGFPGQSKDKYGAHGEDLTIPVPLGTLLKDPVTGQVIAHLEEHGARCMVAKGGKGGAGNIHFKNAHNQFPNIALLGEPSHEREILVELQLLGDVALIGTPSTGKSSLINAVTHVKAKTADYEFTTLIPNLGIVDHKGITFSMIDIPGLISGASEGKGLGNVFLRHILKARVWVIMMNIAKDIPGVQERGALLSEIIQYVEQRYSDSTEFGTGVMDLHHQLVYENDMLTYILSGVIDGEQHILVQKHIITVANKYDLIDAELREEYQKILLTHMDEHISKYTEQNISHSLLETTIYPLSTMTKEGIDSFLNTCITVLDQTVDAAIPHDIVDTTLIKERLCNNITEEEKPMLYEEGYLSEDQHQKVQVREVKNDALAYLCYVLPRGNDEAELRFRNTIDKEGHLKWLQQAGVKKGDVFKIISPYGSVSDRYVMRD